MSVVWRGVNEITINVRRWGADCQRAVVEIMNYFAPLLEAYAKRNAPWSDRTGNARQSLHTLLEELGTDIVTLYLSHGVQYGIYLEVRWAGRYAILWRTIEAHLGEVEVMLRRVFN
jgi:hypothetical protein